MPLVTEKLFSFLLLFFFITSPLEDVFAFNQSHCSCRSLPAIEASASDEIIIPIYFFADEYGGILGISPVTDDLFVWAYSYSSETSETIQALNYAYDSVGNITKIEDYSSTTAKIVNFGYDALYRLSTASTTNASTSHNYLQTWGYNAIGNISTTSAIGDYQYDGHTGTNYANPHAATSIGSMTLNYDRNGNLGTTTQGTTQWLYNWDYKNQLTQAASGTATTTYGYDHNGSRVRMAVNGLATTTYPTKNYNVQGATTTKHIYAGGELIAEVIGNGNSTSTYIVHTDHLGGTHVMTNASGTAVATYDYYPYGDQRISSGSVSEQRRFIGEQYDSGLNLSYLNARYYTGTRGNFLSEDPTFLSLSAKDTQLLSDPQQLNSYSYGRDNPITQKDPTGRALWDLGLSVSGGNYPVALNTGFLIEPGVGYRPYFYFSAGYSYGASAKYDSDGSLNQSQPTGEYKVQRQYAFVPGIGRYGSTQADQNISDPFDLSKNREESGGWAFGLELGASYGVGKEGEIRYSEKYKNAQPQSSGAQPNLYNSANASGQTSSRGGVVGQTPGYGFGPTTQSRLQTTLQSLGSTLTQLQAALLTYAYSLAPTSKK